MNEVLEDSPQVTRTSMLSMQVCVPADWTDEQAERFANEQNPSGLDHGWQMRKEGDSALNGCHARVQCEHPKRPGYVHIMLDC